MNDRIKNLAEQDPELKEALAELEVTAELDWKTAAGALSRAAKNASTASSAAKKSDGQAVLDQVKSAIYMCSIAMHNLGQTTATMKAFGKLDRALTEAQKTWKVMYGD